MRSAIWLKVGIPPIRLYRYLRSVTRLVDRLGLYSLNPANFLIGQQVDGKDRQIRFITALRLLFWDLLSLSQAVSAYGKVSFALSALDKLRNIIEGVSEKQVNERQAFKACFSSTTALGLRWLAKKHASEDAETSTLLRVPMFAIY